MTLIKSITPANNHKNSILYILLKDDMTVEFLKPSDFFRLADKNGGYIIEDHTATIIPDIKFV